MCDSNEVARLHEELGDWKQLAAELIEGARIQAQIATVPEVYTRPYTSAHMQLAIAKYEALLNMNTIGEGL
jgi:hypothetical protein